VLKKRVIPVQLLLGGRLVKTVGFKDYRDVGDPVSSSRVYNAQCADELAFLNIDRESSSLEPLVQLMESVSEVCFMPLAVGGGVRTLADVSYLIRNGADKVVLNSITYLNLSVVSAAADKFGSQAIVVSVDVSREGEQYICWSRCGRQREQADFEGHLEAVESAGAGEILVQSIDRDGTMAGYDMRLIERAMTATTLPVIALGGAGNYEHLREAFVEGGVSAVACGSLFNFSDSNPIRAKAFLSNQGVPVRVV